MKIDKDQYKKMTLHNKDMWDFANNLVLYPPCIHHLESGKLASMPEILGNDAEDICLLIVEVIRTIMSYQRGDSKESALFDRQNEEDYIKTIKYISQYPHIIYWLGFQEDAWDFHKRYIEDRDNTRRQNVNERTLVKDRVRLLYILLEEFPNRPEDSEVFHKVKDEYGKCHKLINKDMQIDIVYQIYKFAGLDNSYGIKYSDPEYPEERAIDSIARERQRLFRRANP